MAAHIEGIRFLSMYDDEEEEDDEDEEDHQHDPKPTDADDGDGDGDGEPAVPEPALENPSPMVRLRFPLLADEVADRKTLASPLPPTRPLPQSQHSSPFPFTSPSPPPPPPVAAPSASAAEPLDPQRIRRGSLAIVDYAHDEATMSPDGDRPPPRGRRWGQELGLGCRLFLGGARAPIPRALIPRRGEFLRLLFPSSHLHYLPSSLIQLLLLLLLLFWWWYQKGKKEEEAEAVDAEAQFHDLAVDDSLIDRKLIERLLKQHSFYQVTTVDSGRKALELLGLRDGVDVDDQGDPPSASPDHREDATGIDAVRRCF